MRSFIVAGIITAAIVVIVVMIVILAYEERRETHFEVGLPRPTRPPVQQVAMCPGAPKGTQCPGWQSDRRYMGDSPFPPRAPSPPIIIKRVEPEYPHAALKARLTGIVILEVGIRRDGSVGGVCTLKPLPCGLDAAAEKAVKQWRFQPVVIKGKPTDVVSNVTVKFNVTP